MRRVVRGLGEGAGNIEGGEGERETSRPSYLSITHSENQLFIFSREDSDARSGKLLIRNLFPFKTFFLKLTVVRELFMG